MKSAFEYTDRGQVFPPHMAAALDAYVQEHRPVGGFLEAVIANDMFRAVARADAQNLNIIGLYCRWFYNHTPGACWGSPEKYREWTRQTA